MWSSVQWRCDERLKDRSNSADNIGVWSELHTSCTYVRFHKLTAWLLSGTASTGEVDYDTCESRLQLKSHSFTEHALYCKVLFAVHPHVFRSVARRLACSANMAATIQARCAEYYLRRFDWLFRWHVTRNAVFAFQLRSETVQRKKLFLHFRVDVCFDFYPLEMAENVCVNGSLLLGEDSL